MTLLKNYIALCLCGRLKVTTAEIFLENSIKMQGGTTNGDSHKRQRELSSAQQQLKAEATLEFWFRGHGGALYINRITKGQLILKADLGAADSPKKRTNEFGFFWHEE